MPEAPHHPPRHAPAIAARRLPASSDRPRDSDPQPQPASRPETRPPHRCSNAAHRPAANPPRPPTTPRPSHHSHAPQDKAQAALRPNVPSPPRAARRTRTFAHSVTESDNPLVHPQMSPASLRPHYPPAGIPDSRWQFPGPSTPRINAPYTPDRIEPANTPHECKSPAHADLFPSATANPKTDSHPHHKPPEHQPEAQPNSKCHRKKSCFTGYPVLGTSYSYRSASIGSSLAARIAGTIPLTTPTNANIPVATTRIIGDKISRMSAASACFATAL